MTTESEKVADELDKEKKQREEAEEGIVEMLKDMAAKVKEEI